MRHIFFTFLFIFFSIKKVFFSKKKIFNIKLFFHIKTSFSAKNVYFVKNTNIFSKIIFFQLKFQNKLTILIFGAKFAQKGYFQPKTD